jgi:hypothetical protein
MMTMMMRMVMMVMIKMEAVAVEEREGGREGKKTSHTELIFLHFLIIYYIIHSLWLLICVDMCIYLFVIIMCFNRLPLWSSVWSSWPQIQRSGFDSRHYQIF